MKAKSGEQDYVCPMHPGVRQQHPGKCPKCRMDLIPEGARFGMLRHMIKSPLMFIVMAAMVVAMILMIMQAR